MWGTHSPWCLCEGLCRVFILTVLIFRPSLSGAIPTETLLSVRPYHLHCLSLTQHIHTNAPTQVGDLKNNPAMVEVLASEV